MDYKTMRDAAMAKAAQKDPGFTEKLRIRREETHELDRALLSKFRGTEVKVLNAQPEVPRTQFSIDWPAYIELKPQPSPISSFYFCKNEHGYYLTLDCMEGGTKHYLPKEWGKDDLLALMGAIEEMPSRQYFKARIPEV